MNIVIISQNQAGWIKPMYTALYSQFGDELKAVWVFDRCTDNSIEIANSLNIKYLENKTGEGRLTSSCRNAGCTYAEMLWGEDDTCFLDGDRIPLTNLNVNYNTDVSLIFLEKDFRTTCEVPYSEIYGTVYNNFFSCGLVIKKEALKKLKEFYKEREEDYGSSTIFPETVQKYWGIEDTHLGDICYHIGLSTEERPDLLLRGTFDRNVVDSLDVIETRFKLRDKLNVKW